jgi:hypothetical protein
MLFFVISDTKASYSSSFQMHFVISDTDIRHFRYSSMRSAFFFFGYFGNDDRQRKLMKVKVTRLSTGCKA